MKALVKKEARPGLWLEEVPKPTLEPHQVLIRIKKTAICGTDRHIYDWDAWAQSTLPLPLVVGHECMGEVVEIGSMVQHLKVGQRVAVEGHLTCGICVNCRTGLTHLCQAVKGIGYDKPGAFAQYFAITAHNVIPLPDAISDEVAAILDPLGNAVHAVMSFEVACRDILIAGAGPIGLLALAVAKKVGVKSVTICDINPFRLKLAETMGADALFNPEKDDIEVLKARLHLKEGFDIGFEMSGVASSLVMLFEHLRFGGKIGLMGIYPKKVEVDFNKAIFRSLFIKGVYGREMFKTWYQTMQLLQSGLDVTPVITHHFPYTEFESAFEILSAGQSSKVVMDWA